MKKKNILVIGGTGFIGYHLLRKTSKIGWNSFSISRNKPKQFRRINNVKYIKVNINNLIDLKKKLTKKYDYVVNLSSSTRETPSSYIKNLEKIFFNNSIRKFIHVGSSAEYGNIKQLPHTENLKCKPNSFYGKQKLKITNFLLNRFKKKFFPLIILRLFQVYGQKDNKEKILPHVLKNCLKNKKFKLTKGEQTRDFCHVDDVIKAILLVLKNKNKNIYGKIFNIGTGKSISVKNLVQIIQYKTNKGKPIFGAKNLMEKEIIFSKASIRKIKKFINWSPRITIEKGINDLIKYEK